MARRRYWNAFQGCERDCRGRERVRRQRKQQKSEVKCSGIAVEDVENGSVTLPTPMGRIGGELASNDGGASRALSCRGRAAVVLFAARLRCRACAWRMKCWLAAMLKHTSAQSDLGRGPGLRVFGARRHHQSWFRHVWEIWSIPMKYFGEKAEILIIALG